MKHKRRYIVTKLVRYPVVWAKDDGDAVRIVKLHEVTMPPELVEYVTAEVGK